MDQFLLMFVDAGGYLIIAAVVFFLLMSAAAFIAFKLLRKTLRMTLRLLVAGLVLVAAVAGSTAMWYYSQGTSKTGKQGPKPIKNSSPR